MKSYISCLPYQSVGGIDMTFAGTSEEGGKWKEDETNG